MLSKLLLLILFLFISIQPAQAFWIWTPESGEWVNPKYAVKETPAEQFDFAKSFYDSEQHSKALLEFRKLVKHYHRSREAAESQYYMGQIYEVLNKPFEAVKEYQEIIDKYPFSERSAEIVGLQFNLAEGLLATTEDNIWSTLAGSSLRIIEIYEQVIKNAPYGKYAPEAQYKIGLIYYEQALYDEAREAWEKVVNEYPDHEFAKLSKYKIAIADEERSSEAQYEQSVTQEAVEEFEEFIESYPEAELAKDAKDRIKNLREKEAENAFVVAQFYEKQGKKKAAKIYYGSVVSDYRDTSWAQKALDKLQDLGDF